MTADPAIHLNNDKCSQQYLFGIYLFKVTQELLAQCVKSFRYLYCLLCTDFIHCSAVSTVDSEQVDTGWVVT